MHDCLSTPMLWRDLCARRAAMQPGMAERIADDLVRDTLRTASGPASGTGIRVESPDPAAELTRRRCSIDNASWLPTSRAGRRTLAGVCGRRSVSHTVASLDYPEVERTLIAGGIQKG